MAEKTGRKKKGWTNAKHRGVTILKRALPSGRVSYRARYVDPETGRVTKETLKRADAQNRDTRRDWAIRKSQALDAKRAALDDGIKPQAPTDLEDAITDYLEARGAELRPKTIAVYGLSCDVLKEWAEGAGVVTVEEIGTAQLADLRTAIVSRKHRYSAKDEKRGTHKEGEETRSAATINRDLRALRTLLTEWRRQEKLPRLDGDAIKDGLRSVRGTRPVPTFLRTPEIRKLLKAAERHDATTHKITRGEKAGERPVGTSPKFPPITPFVLTVLLTGARLGEIVGLRWDEVHLDSDEIVLDANRVKTGHGRRIDLRVSPSLKAVLSSLKLRAGDAPEVFAGYTDGKIHAARKRLIKAFGAPKFTWQELRRTCGTFLTCAPGIYGAASAFLSAKRLGHSVLVAEKHYVGALTEIAPEARTLEAAMRIEDLVGPTPAATSACGVG